MNANAQGLQHAACCFIAPTLKNLTVYNNYRGYISNILLILQIKIKLIGTWKWILQLPSRLLNNTSNYIPHTSSPHHHSRLTVDVFILSNQVRGSPTLSLSALQLWDLSSQNRARGPRARFGCLSAREASGQRRGLWSVCQSKKWQQPPLARTVPVAFVCHIQNNESVSHTFRGTNCEYLFWHVGAFLFFCGDICILALPHAFLVFAWREGLLLSEVDTAKRQETLWGTRQSHSIRGITETQTGLCVHTHRQAFQKWCCSHVTMASASLGHGSVVSDHLFSFPPCLFSRDSVINSLTRD